MGMLLLRRVAQCVVTGPREVESEVPRVLGMGTLGPAGSSRPETLATEDSSLSVGPSSWLTPSHLVFHSFSSWRQSWLLFPVSSSRAFSVYMCKHSPGHICFLFPICVVV